MDKLQLPTAASAIPSVRFGESRALEF